MAEMENQGLTIIRRPQVDRKRGTSKSSTYLDIQRGTWPPPIRLGARARGWLLHEADAVLRARAAGASDDELRALVKRLVAQRREARIAAAGSMTDL